MARANNVYIVTLNTRPLASFTVKHECRRYLERAWPKCPTNLRVLRLRDGREDIITDFTGHMYGLD